MFFAVGYPVREGLGAYPAYLFLGLTVGAGLIAVEVRRNGRRSAESFVEIDL